MDPLADVLDVARVTGAVAATVDAGGDWGLSLLQVPGAAFHAVTCGTVWLRVGQAAPLRLDPGDVVLLPRGSAHTLSSSPVGDTVPFDHLAAKQQLGVGGALRVGDNGTSTRILCASYQQDREVALPVLELLPDLVHVPAALAETSLTDTLRLLAVESATPRPGGRVVLDRLVDVLLVHVLRSWLAIETARQQPGGRDPTQSWLHALRDPVVAGALSVLHAEPAVGWTLADLAGRVGVSRATIARRFPALVGQSPMQYLTAWRLDLAAARLRHGDEPLDAVARAVGYGSEHALSRAFSRARGLPPGRYRAASRHGPPRPR